MGLTIVLEGETGDKLALVEDPKNLLIGLFPDQSDDSFACLRFVDPYQITTFNQRQIAPLTADLKRIAANAATPEARELLEAVLDLARKCASQPHLYLRFYGD